MVLCTFDWGDKTTSHSGLVKSGAKVDASHTWTNIGVYNVKAKATDSKGLDSEWSSTINVSIVNRPPIPPEKPIGVIIGYALATYSYVTSSTDPDGDMVLCTFDWGDKTTSHSGLVKSGTKVEASHIWTKAGTYHVKAKAMDKIGDESLYSSSLTVIVNPNSPPTVSGKPSGSATCIAGSSYSYSALAIDPDKDQVEYTFDWADGIKTKTNLVNSGTKSSAIHAWNMAGTYQVKVTAMDSKGAASGSSSSLTVTVNPNRSPTAPGKPSGSAKGYAGAACSYTTSAKDLDGDKIKYSFDWGDGTKTDTKLVNSGTRYSAAHAWSAAGTYRVKARAVDSKEVASQYSGYLSVKISPNGVPGKPSVPLGAVTGNVKKSYIYRTSATDPDGDKLKYKFDWGDGKTSQTSFVSSGKSASSSHAWSKAGTYQVKVMAEDSKGASSVSWSSSLAVKIN
jgi:PKD domain